MIRIEEGYKLSTGKQFYAYDGILGMAPDGDLTYGYDGVVDVYPSFTPSERREIADAMVEAWKEWGNA